jgi:hypothetical protein
MWANRMPRRVLPVRRTDTPVIEADRLVPADVDDFCAFVRYVAERYWVRPNYLRVDGRAYFSIFDSTYFMKELGVDGARAAIAAARAMLASAGLPPMYLTAIEPNADVIGQVAAIGFDAVTNYVLLPEWKGEFLQDYDACVARRAAQWPQIAAAAGLPYHPAVTPGWDASPRGADFGRGPAPTSTRGRRSSSVSTPTSSAPRWRAPSSTRGRAAATPISSWCWCRRSTSGARVTTSSPTPGSAPRGSRR